VNIKLIDFDAEHYATNLTYKGGSLKWESVGATHFMILRSAFGTEIKLSQSHIDCLKAMEEGQILCGEEAALECGNSDMHFIVFPRSGVNVFSVMVKPAAYAVYACSYEGGVLTVYNPSDACFERCSVAAKVRISLKKVPLPKKGFLDKIKELTKTEQEEERLYYNVSFPHVPNYAENMLCYGYAGCDYRFPITAQMLGKTVLIPEFEGNAPKVESLDSKAYKVVVCN